jgi:hypothetical protein
MGQEATMELAISRKANNETQCTGEMTRDAKHQCWTLEDPVRRDPDPNTPANEGKIYGKTAIPAGRYKVTITFSQKFQRDMMLVNEVPGFTGIRLHGGRDAEDTLGCPLLGYKRDGELHLSDTLQASHDLFAVVKIALDRDEEVWLTVTDDFPEGDLQ